MLGMDAMTLVSVVVQLAVHKVIVSPCINPAEEPTVIVVSPALALVTVVVKEGRLFVSVSLTVVKEPEALTSTVKGKLRNKLINDSIKILDIQNLFFWNIFRKLDFIIKLNLHLIFLFPLRLRFT